MRYAADACESDLGSSPACTIAPASAAAEWSSIRPASACSAAVERMGRSSTPKTAIRAEPQIPLAVDLDRDGRAGEREVALLARDLREAEALPMRAPGMRTWVSTSSGASAVVK